MSEENTCSFLMMKAAHTSETSVDNNFTRQYIPEDNSELHTIYLVVHFLITLTIYNIFFQVHFMYRAGLPQSV
jgi:hypothetical protein